MENPPEKRQKTTERLRWPKNASNRKGGQFVSKKDLPAFLAQSTALGSSTGFPSPLPSLASQKTSDGETDLRLNDDQEIDRKMGDNRDLVERLEYIGLSTEAITHIASVYDRERDPRADLWDYIAAWVLSRRSNEYVAEDGYQQELIRCGLSDELAAKHMDAEFAVFRRMQDPWYWALDTLRMRHDQLDFIEEAMGDPSDGGNEDGGTVRSLGTGPPKKSSSESAIRPDKGKGRGASVTEEGVADGIPGGATNFRSPGSDEVIWLKGATKSRFWSGYSATTLRMNPRSILSMPPTDFGGLHNCLYLTDSADAAKLYAGWATRRGALGPGSEALILCLYIPKQWLRALQEQNQIRYLITDEFQHLVWWSHRDSQAGPTPNAIQDIHQSKVIYGPINPVSPKQVRRLANSNEIVPYRFQGGQPAQICVLVSKEDVLDKLAGFEAQLVKPEDLPAVTG